MRLQSKRDPCTEGHKGHITPKYMKTKREKRENTPNGSIIKWLMFVVLFLRCLDTTIQDEYIDKGKRLKGVWWKGTYLVQTTTSWKPVQITAKKLSKFTKKITHVDDMMIYNLVKYLFQTQLRLWDIKITNFKPESCPNDLLEIYYFYISQTKSSLNKIFYKVVYHLHVWLFWWI